MHAAGLWRGAPGRVTHGLEAGEAPRLGFQRVDGQGLEDAAAGVRGVIPATADGAPGPGIDDVERQGDVRRNRGWKPSTEGQARNRTPATASPIVAVAASGSG